MYAKGLGLYSHLNYFGTFVVKSVIQVLEYQQLSLKFEQTTIENKL